MRSSESRDSRVNSSTPKAISPSYPLRHLATGMLVIMLVILVLTNVFLSLHPSLGYLRAFAEAAVVGALADWFAVTALFRQPLRLPIPHTAIIPRNKDRIGAALGRFVEHNFASPEVAAAKLGSVDLSGRLVQWLGAEARIHILADHVAHFIPKLLDSLDEHYVCNFISEGVAERAVGANLGPLLGEVVAMLASENRHQLLLDNLLREADEYIAANEPRVRQQVRENTAWFWQQLSMDEKIADSTILALRESVTEIARTPDHPLRLRLDAALEKLATELATSPKYREQIVAHTRRLLDLPAIRDYLTSLWRDIRAALGEDIGSDNSVIENMMKNATRAAAEALLRDSALRERLNGWMRDLIVEGVRSHQRDVGMLIADTVRGWDSETITRRIEQQVGEDLQYIRINGTLIGGLVGLVIYTLTQAFG